MVYKKEEMLKKKCLMATIRDNKEFIFFMLFLSLLLMIPSLSIKIAAYISNIKPETMREIVRVMLYVFTITTTIKIVMKGKI